MISDKYRTGSYSNMMESITSKRDFKKFYIELFAVIFFIIGLGAIALYKFIYEHQTSTNVDSKYNLLLLLTISSLGFTYYYTSEYLKKTPSITITPEYIFFNDERFSVADIAYIKLTGKRAFVISDMECTMIVFKNNTAKLIFDDMYANTSQMKSTLDYIINNKIHIVKQIDKNNISNMDFKHYKGIIWLNFRIIVLALYLMFALVLMSKSIKAFLIGLAIFCLVTLLVYPMYNYFCLNNEYVVVKNHLHFWKKDIYNISDIELVSFEVPKQRSPNSIKIICKNFTSKEYYVASLTDSKLKELKEELIKLNINIRNEINI